MDDWLIRFYQDLCAYAAKNNVRNLTSAAENALEVATQETGAATQLKRPMISSQHVGTIQVRQKIMQKSDFVPDRAHVNPALPGENDNRRPFLEFQHVLLVLVGVGFLNASEAVCNRPDRCDQTCLVSWLWRFDTFFGRLPPPRVRLRQYPKDRVNH